MQQRRLCNRASTVGVVVAALFFVGLYLWAGPLEALPPDFSWHVMLAWVGHVGLAVAAFADSVLAGILALSLFSATMRKSHLQQIHALLPSLQRHFKHPKVVAEYVIMGLSITIRIFIEVSHNWQLDATFGIILFELVIYQLLLLVAMLQKHPLFDVNMALREKIEGLSDTDFQRMNSEWAPVEESKILQEMLIVVDELAQHRLFDVVVRLSNDVAIKAVDEFKQVRSDKYRQGQILSGWQIFHLRALRVVMLAENDTTCRRMAELHADVIFDFVQRKVKNPNDYLIDDSWDTGKILIDVISPQLASKWGTDLAKIAEWYAENGSRTNDVNLASTSHAIMGVSKSIMNQAFEEGRMDVAVEAAESLMLGCWLWVRSLNPNICDDITECKRRFTNATINQVAHVLINEALSEKSNGAYSKGLAAWRRHSMSFSTLDYPGAHLLLFNYGLTLLMLAQKGHYPEFEWTEFGEEINRPTDAGVSWAMEAHEWGTYVAGEALKMLTGQIKEDESKANNIMKLNDFLRFKRDAHSSESNIDQRWNELFEKLREMAEQHPKTITKYIHWPGKESDNPWKAE